jgi:hypothetical protein
MLAFLSRHSDDLWMLMRRDELRGDRLCACIDYAKAANHVPGRESTPWSFLQAVGRWHRRMAQIRNLAEAEGLMEDFHAPVEDLVFPVPPCPGWTDGESFIVPIADVKALLLEANRMRHCVVSRLPDVLGHRIALYHGEACGEPITIEIGLTRKRPDVNQASGVENKPLSHDQNRVLGAFVRHLECAKERGCGCAVVPLDQPTEPEPQTLLDAPL